MFVCKPVCPCQTNSKLKFMKDPIGNLFDSFLIFINLLLCTSAFALDLILFCTAVQEKEDETCPLCKSTKYLNPKMTLLVSPCYHRLCETCINRLFLHGSAPCPLCATILRKGNFVVPTFEDLKVEKEVRIRKIVSKA